jgi:hypothetical protein
MRVKTETSLLFLRDREEPKLSSAVSKIRGKPEVSPAVARIQETPIFCHYWDSEGNQNYISLLLVKV